MSPTRKVTLTERICDGCGNARFDAEDGEMAHGYHGQVMHISGTGGDGADWYACRDRCVGPAVRNALARPDNSEVEAW